MLLEARDVQPKPHSSASHNVSWHANALRSAKDQRNICVQPRSGACQPRYFLVGLQLRLLLRSRPAGLAMIDTDCRLCACWRRC